MTTTDLTTTLKQAVPELQSIAPKFVNVQRLVQLAIEAKMHTPILSQASPISVLNFCKKCAEMGTDRVGAGGMWPIPFYNGKTKAYDMAPIPDWRLLVEKAKKAKAITHCSVDAVFESDVFEYERGLVPILRHVPGRGDRGKIVAVYCVYQLPDGNRDFVVMDWETEIVPIRDRSKAYQAYQKDNTKTCPWNTDEAEMGKKTVVKRTMKLFEGASIELTNLIELDNTALGFTDDHFITERPAVDMPKELPPSTTPPPTQETPPPADNDGDTVTGVVGKIAEKPGKKKNGDPYVRYGIVIDGQSYGTFDENLAETAKDLQGEEVVLTYEMNGRYKNAVSIVPANAEGKENKQETDDPDQKDSLIEEITKIEADMTDEKIQEVYAEAKVDPTDPLEDMSIAKLKEIKQGYGVLL